ncbi:hypothetical protein FN846DRAFT_584938 [Sphaerosporella brunnea]|uniref:Uncharacterized protein n=1 Tax=Sphaerosporella brunnea TaxID=1250544 RepID=A0A5J5ECC9_9PEZI|nr:hypothetical protein FN846DRAFT_584938 [Sphaerosporella brunnea]
MAKRTLWSVEDLLALGFSSSFTLPLRLRVGTSWADVLLVKGRGGGDSRIPFPPLVFWGAFSTTTSVRYKQLDSYVFWDQESLLLVLAPMSPSTFEAVERGSISKLSWSTGIETPKFPPYGSESSSWSSSFSSESFTFFPMKAGTWRRTEGETQYL